MRDKEEIIYDYENTVYMIKLRNREEDKETLKRLENEAIKHGFDFLDRLEAFKSSQLALFDDTKKETDRKAKVERIIRRIEIVNEIGKALEELGIVIE